MNLIFLEKTISGKKEIRININQKENCIEIYDNGKGLPVAIHPDKNEYIPSMVFSQPYFEDDAKFAEMCKRISTKCIVETSSIENKKKFRQIWIMSKATEREIGISEEKDFTRITFYPDLKKLNMNSLDDDIVALMRRHAYDVAGFRQGEDVYLNNAQLPKSFGAYVNLYIKENFDYAGEPLKVFYAKKQKGWEVAVTLSNHRFQHVSFVNSVETTEGGTHVDYVLDLIIEKVMAEFETKKENGINMTKNSIKNNMWIFISCQVENPIFDSQNTKLLSNFSVSYTNNNL